jgi:hypothetical protein
MVAGNASRKKLRQLRDQLRQAGGGNFELTGDYRWPFEGGRLVCSLSNLDMHNGHDFDLVIFLDALQVLSANHARAFARLDYQRVYGFLSQDRPMSGTGRLLLQAHFGPTLHRSYGPLGSPAAVRVLWVQPPWVGELGDVSSLERKRLGFWHREERNDFVARVASSCSTGTETAVSSCGIVLPDGWADWPGGGPAVTVLVESAEHGRELLGRLPGWGLLSALTPDQEIDPYELSPLATKILTLVEASRFHVADTDVLVVAGPESPFELKAFPPRSQAGGVLVVDLADDFDQAARAAVRRRLESYEARGWPSAGTLDWALTGGKAPVRRGRR